MINPDQAVKGVKVQTNPNEPVLTIKYGCGRYAAVEIVNEDGTREDMGMCPMAMLDLVEE